MTVIKSKEIVFCVPVSFLKTRTFYKDIDIKSEMNLCSGMTAKLADVSPLKETVA